MVRKTYKVQIHKNDLLKGKGEERKQNKDVLTRAIFDP